MERVTGTEFEDYVWRGFWLREFPPSDQWSSDRQKRLLEGRIRPDFSACRGNERAIGDAKDKAVITYADVDKLVEDAGVYRAMYCYLIIAGDTNIPKRVRAHAESNGVAIIRTRWRA